jgi:aspartyl protease family protein
MFSMLRLLAIGVVGAISAAASAEAVMSFDHARRDHDLQRAEAVSGPAPLAEVTGVAPAGGSAASVVKGPDGHYWAEAAVNGQAVHFLVDTGATAVTLTATDALRLGLSPASLRYDLKMITASGETRGARVKLANIAVAGVQVQNVDAIVAENGLSTSLLGMTYLGRLSQFEATPTALILRP